MKFKVAITNFKSFRLAISECAKPVLWIDKDSKKSLDDVKSMEELHKKFIESGYFMKLWVETKQQSDYFRVISCCCWANY